MKHHEKTGEAMTDDIKESLSAFMDSELEDHQTVLDQLKTDDELRATWARYHVIRDAMQQRHLAAASVISHRVSLAMANEPVLLAPRKLTHAHYRKRAAGWAIAASLLLVSTLWFAQSDYFGAEVDSNGFAINTSSPQVSAEAEQALSDYLVNHNEYSASGRMQGMLPYTRIVSYTPANQAAAERIE